VVYPIKDKTLRIIILCEINIHWWCYQSTKIRNWYKLRRGAQILSSTLFLLSHQENVWSQNCYHHLHSLRPHRHRWVFLILIACTMAYRDQWPRLSRLVLKLLAGKRLFCSLFLTLIVHDFITYGASESLRRSDPRSLHLSKHLPSLAILS